MITGDIDHHTGIDAAARGLSILDAGHYGLEHIFVILYGRLLQGEITGTEHIQPEVTISVFLYCINSNQRNGGLLWEKLNVELIFMET